MNGASVTGAMRSGLSRGHAAKRNAAASPAKRECNSQPDRNSMHKVNPERTKFTHFTAGSDAPNRA
jgi:hypothetical protein